MIKIHSSQTFVIERGGDRTFLPFTPAYSINQAHNLPSSVSEMQSFLCLSALSVAQKAHDVHQMTLRTAQESKKNHREQEAFPSIQRAALESIHFRSALEH